jgi:tetratricopeptide (TPR) repeat protein
VATAYNNIGNLFKRKGRYEKALEYYSKSLKIKIKLFGGRSEGVAASLSNIALLEW